jgi:hypothetical protein
MSPGVRQALNYSDFRNDFAWLLLRVINNLGPCAGTSLVAYISGDCTKPGPPTVRIIRNALLKLEALGFIEFTQQQIDLTDAGRRFLQELAINPASPCAPYATPLSPSLATSPANPRLKRLCKQYLVETRACDAAEIPNQVASKCEMACTDVPHERGSRLAHCSALA